MILTEAKTLQDDNAARFAWSNLRRYLNTDFVEDQLCRLHEVPAKQRGNAKKQARQIRYCLMQAREYADAAERVSLVTKPTLFYYSTMCLALAEILLKQTGDASLDRAREDHRHHGLLFSAGTPGKGRPSLDVAASALRAKPAMNIEGRFGTFELWHRSCRETPVSGKFTDRRGMGTTTQHTVIAAGSDARLALLPKSGLDFMQVLKKIPGLLAHLGAMNIQSDLIRARLERERPSATTGLMTLLIHPTPDPQLTTFMTNCKFDPNACELINFHEIHFGGHLDLNINDVFGPVRFNLPHGSMWNEEEVRFWPSDQPLNEFGYYYVALFIIGNYARYYPDRWIADVECSTELALVVEELLRAAETRVPLLALSELSRIYYVMPS